MKFFSLPLVFLCVPCWRVSASKRPFEGPEDPGPEKWPRSDDPPAINALPLITVCEFDRLSDSLLLDMIETMVEGSYSFITTLPCLSSRFRLLASFGFLIRSSSRFQRLYINMASRNWAKFRCVTNDFHKRWADCGQLGKFLFRILCDMRFSDMFDRVTKLLIQSRTEGCLLRFEDDLCKLLEDNALKSICTLEDNHMKAQKSRVAPDDPEQSQTLYYTLSDEAMLSALYAPLALDSSDRDLNALFEKLLFDGHRSVRMSAFGLWFRNPDWFERFERIFQKTNVYVGMVNFGCLKAESEAAFLPHLKKFLDFIGTKVFKTPADDWRRLAYKLHIESPGHRLFCHVLDRCRMALKFEEEIEILQSTTQASEIVEKFYIRGRALSSDLCQELSNTKFGSSVRCMELCGRWDPGQVQLVFGLQLDVGLSYHEFIEVMEGSGCNNRVKFSADERLRIAAASIESLRAYVSTHFPRQLLSYRQGLRPFLSHFTADQLCGDCLESWLIIEDLNIRFRPVSDDFVNWMNRQPLAIKYRALFGLIVSWDNVNHDLVKALLDRCLAADMSANFLTGLIWSIRPEKSARAEKLLELFVLNPHCVNSVPDVAAQIQDTLIWVLKPHHYRPYMHVLKLCAAQSDPEPSLSGAISVFSRADNEFYGKSLVEVLWLIDLDFFVPILASVDRAGIPDEQEKRLVNNAFIIAASRCNGSSSLEPVAAFCQGRLDVGLMDQILEHASNNLGPGKHRYNLVAIGMAIKTCSSQ